MTKSYTNVFLSLYIIPLITTTSALPRRYQLRPPLHILTLSFFNFGFRSWRSEKREDWGSGRVVLGVWLEDVVEKYSAGWQGDIMFFEKIFCQFEKCSYFCARFWKKKCHENWRLIGAVDINKPHSSSGPGHLPLTQKIISSTLICGTKAIESTNSVAFFFHL